MLPNLAAADPHPSAAYSSSVSNRDRIMNRNPVGASSENPAPRPGTRSMVRWVCFQYSYCGADMYTGTSPTPCTSSTPHNTSAPSVTRNSPAG